MTDPRDEQHRSILQRIARQAMLDKGLVPDFPPPALAELDRITGPSERRQTDRRATCATCSGAPSITTIRATWTSLPLPRPCPAAPSRSWWPLPTWTPWSRRRSALDDHARQNTTSVYTAAETFPDAAGEALHRPDLAQLRRGPPGHRRRDGGRRGRIAAELGHLPGDGAQPRQARLQQRGRLAGGKRADAAGDRRGRRPGREPPPPGPRGPEAEGAPASARRAGPGNDRSAPGL